MSNFVQAASATYTTSTSFTNSLTGVGVGNTLVVCFSYQNNSNIGTVSGGAAHWTQVAFINFEANNSLAIFIAPNATGGNTTVTVSISPSNNLGAFTLSEYKSAVTTLDQKGTSSGTGSSFNTATLTTRFANETLIVFMGGDAGTASVSSPFNNRAGISFSGVTYARTADLDEATAGMYFAACTQGSRMPYGTCIVSLYLPSTGIPGALAMLGCGAT